MNPVNKADRDLKWTTCNVWFPLQEPTDSLEETLLMSQPDFSLGVENGSEEGDNPSGTHTDNPSNHSPNNARVYQLKSILHVRIIKCVKTNYNFMEPLRIPLILIGIQHFEEHACLLQAIYNYKLN